MSDLVKRLRSVSANPIFLLGVPGKIPAYVIATEAADRIEELEAKLSKSEALLDKAINAMEKTACDNYCCECDDDQKGVAPWCGFITRTVLTEITKERSDEKGDKP